MTQEFTVQEIPPEAVRLWKLLHEILDQGRADTWESEGGRQGEFGDVSVKLHALLGLRPWEEHAIAAGSPEPPGWMTDERRRADYRRAHRLFLIMEAAAKAARPENAPPAIRASTDMSVDLLKLLRDCVRGQRWDHDIPALPGAIDEHGGAADSSREELELFAGLLEEVFGEDPDPRPSIVRRVEQLKQECLGPGAAPADGAESCKTFRLLDRDGAPAKDPESVVALELRDANGNTEAFPFRWAIPGLIGHASGPGMKFD